MKVYAGMSDRVALMDTIAYAQRVERLGYDGLHVPETVHDGLAVSLLALEHTTTLEVRTSLILAFPRSPMLTALSAWDLALMSGGRFQLGIGSQIRQNVEGRFSIPWRDPIGKMREYVESLRAIWHTFATGAPLSVSGEHYTFSRLQPFFNPGPLPEGVAAPTIWLGGVNRRILELAGTHADGFVTHPTNSNPRYLDELCLPVLRAGGRPIELVTGSPYITGPDAAAVDAARAHQRRMFGFLYSTPAYRRSLELFGWAELGERLQAMTRADAWDQLHELVTDEVLDTLVPQGQWEELPELIGRWFVGRAQGVILPVPADPVLDDRFREVVRAVQAL